jgi:hypothetical protein
MADDGEMKDDCKMPEHDKDLAKKIRDLFEHPDKDASELF